MREWRIQIQFQTHHCDKKKMSERYSSTLCPWCRQIVEPCKIYCVPLSLCDCLYMCGCLIVGRRFITLLHLAHNSWYQSYWKGRLLDFFSCFVLFEKIKEKMGVLSSWYYVQRGQSGRLSRLSLCCQLLGTDDE